MWHCRVVVIIIIIIIRNVARYQCECKSLYNYMYSYVASSGHWTSSFASSLWPIFYNVKCGTLGDSWLLHADALSVDESMVSVWKRNSREWMYKHKEVDGHCLRRHTNDVQNIETKNFKWSSFYDEKFNKGLCIDKNLK